MPRWLIRYGQARPAAPCLFILFHYAGGGASAFRSWSRHAGGRADCLAVQLPGRETRAGEPLCGDLKVVVEEVCADIADLAGGRPVVLFGHSMGAALAHRAAERGERDGLFALAGLGVSARRAPHLAPFEPDLRNHSDAQLLECLESFGGMPPEVQAEPDILASLLERVRADFLLADACRCAQAPATPLRAPVLALGGAEDPTVALDHLLPWRAYTSGPFKMALLPGGHFYMRDEKNILETTRALLALADAR